MSDTDPAEVPTPRPGSGIHTAILAVVAALPSIGKDRKMTEGPKYNYRGIEDIIPHVRDAFLAEGVTIEATYRLISAESYQTDRGKTWRRTMLEGTFTFTASDGSTMVMVTIGEGTDMGDKSSNKAMTAAEKYALTIPLFIGDHDDGDHLPSSESAGEAWVAEADAQKAFFDASGGDRDVARERWASAALQVENGWVSAAALRDALGGPGETAAPPAEEPSSAEPAATEEPPARPAAAPEPAQPPAGRILVGEAKQRLVAALDGDINAAGAVWADMDLTVTDGTVSTASVDSIISGLAGN